ncbi:MAG: aminoacyl-tRNA hydrolase [Bryobacterales bacterium]|nr:aminoacyl-tRNA hydrolase [Bryobacterales bacterium]
MSASMPGPLESSAAALREEAKPFLIVGLGNPGNQYELTPHNIGFQVVDRLAERLQVRISQRSANALIGFGREGKHPLILAKPQTYMNLSGTAVKPLLANQGLSASQLIVVYDDFDLPFTGLRIRLQGSAGTHNGMKSLVGSLGTGEFVRVRLGIHPQHPFGDAARFVLAKFRKADLADVAELVDYASDAVLAIVSEGAEKAMTKFNRRARGSNEEEI